MDSTNETQLDNGPSRGTPARRSLLARFAPAFLVFLAFAPPVPPAGATEPRSHALWEDIVREPSLPVERIRELADFARIELPQGATLRDLLAVLSDPSRSASPPHARAAWDLFSSQLPYGTRLYSSLEGREWAPGALLEALVEPVYLRGKSDLARLRGPLPLELPPDFKPGQYFLISERLPVVGGSYYSRRLEPASAELHRHPRLAGWLETYYRDLVERSVCTPEEAGELRAADRALDARRMVFRAQLDPETRSLRSLARIFDASPKAAFRPHFSSHAQGTHHSLLRFKPAKARLRLPLELKPGGEAHTPGIEALLHPNGARQVALEIGRVFQARETADSTLGTMLWLSKYYYSSHHGNEGGREAFGAPVFGEVKPGTGEKLWARSWWQPALGPIDAFPRQMMGPSRGEDARVPESADSSTVLVATRPGWLSNLSGALGSLELPARMKPRKAPINAPKPGKRAPRSARAS